MAKTTVVHLRARKITTILEESYPLLIMIISYIIGVALGAALIKSSDKIADKATLYYEAFIKTRNSGNFVSVFSASIIEWLPFILALFACGTCIVGMAVLPLIICYKGFYYGALAGYIYSAFSLNGIVFVLLLIIPGTLIGAFGLFFAGKKAFAFSLLLARSVMPRGSNYDMYNILSYYCKTFVYLILVIVLASLADTSLCMAFFEKIKFI